MPITLGILAQARQEAAGATFQLLESTVLGSAQASVEFTNLTTKYASTYQHLQVRAVVNQNTTGGAEFLRMQVNADTAANYSWHRLTGNGSAVSSSAGANANHMFVGVVPLLGTSNIFGAQVIDILDPFETTKNTTVRSLSGLTGDFPFVDLFSGSWRNTASITSMKFDSNFNSSLRAGTRFSLYGIRSVA